MKKSNIIILSVGSILLIIALFGSFIISKVWDSDVSEVKEHAELDWHHIVLSEDERKDYYPESYVLNNGLELKIMDSLIGKTRPFELIERRSGDTETDLGSGKNILITDSRRALYKTEDKEPNFKVWVEEMSAADHKIYQEMTRKEFQSFDDFDMLEKNYKGIQYIMSHKVDLSSGGLKEVNTIALTYIFFPQENLAVFMTFFNSKYQNCDGSGFSGCDFQEDEYVVSKNDVEKITKDLIDNVK